MSLASCEKCWDDTCTCGWKYRNYKPEYIKSLLQGLIKYRSKEEISSMINEILEEENKKSEDGK